MEQLGYLPPAGYEEQDCQRQAAPVEHLAVK